MTSSPASPSPQPPAGTDRHLDLGCGSRPRNPYGRAQLFGVDISDMITPGGATVRRANLAIDPIPFEDNAFASVSAYDFLEHVPRVLPTADGRTTRFPFVELMNEIWRVLAPGGLFYAQTPAFPSTEAFRDPTHVNILTHDAHLYFTRPERMASIYGFTGDFDVVRVLRVRPEFEYEPPSPDWRRRQKMKRRERRGDTSHVIWELRACKAEAR